MPTVGSLFSGIGALDLGLERAGFEIAFQIEIDSYCQQVLAKHWPDVKRYGDIKTVGAASLFPVDLICAGFPCQPFSVAGQKKGVEDDRFLWPEIIRIVRVLRPAFLLLENVPGLLIRGLGRVLGELAASGYHAEWRCISAAEVGAPHRRKRLFIVAYPSSFGFVQAVVFNNDLKEDLEKMAAQAQEYWSGKLNLCPSGRVRLVPVDRVLGVGDGRSQSMDAVKAIGNAVVPQVIEVIGRQIIKLIEKGVTNERTS